MFVSPQATIYALTDYIGSAKMCVIAYGFERKRSLNDDKY